MNAERLLALADRIDRILPQTQCRRCGYAGCRPYADAIADANESINLCPPGGEPVRRALAQLLGRDLIPPTALHLSEPARVAFVVEADCIGCAKCIRACPVDAIVGSQGSMHSVVQQWCSGCDLCAPVCPTDCIDMLPIAKAATAPSADALRARFEARKLRLASALQAQAWEGYVDLEGVAPEALRNDVMAAVRRRRER
jgi:electron transport complex protein RnfB